MKTTSVQSIGQSCLRIGPFAARQTLRRVKLVVKLLFPSCDARNGANERVKEGVFTVVSITVFLVCVQEGE